MRSNRVEDVEYDAAWPERFEEIRGHVSNGLSGVAADVEHVGSTAVPGLAAKPIIDVDVVVTSADDVPRVTDRLVALGYEAEGDLGVDGRLAFRPPEELPSHHLYLVVDGSPPHRDHVDLREYLRGHPVDAERYGARKRELARESASDRAAYTAGKAAMVEELLDRARRSPNSL